MPQQERPAKPVSETYQPGGTRHPVKTGESWDSIAQGHGIDAWDLIDFNFPGTKQTKPADFQRASRHVNWYLSKYVGCQTPSADGQNWSFTSGLTNGKGVWKGGVIYIPPGRSAGQPARWTPPPLNGVYEATFHWYSPDSYIPALGMGWLRLRPILKAESSGTITWLPGGIWRWEPRFDVTGRTGTTPGLVAKAPEMWHSKLGAFWRWDQSDVVLTIASVHVATMFHVTKDELLAYRFKLAQLSHDELVAPHPSRHFAGAPAWYAIKVRGGGKWFPDFPFDFHWSFNGFT